ncbi:Cytochrome P450 4C1 [Acromyrmex echinatior]|uniref:Cytochrome P450 4C1 n=1 Tax=Acromyrmex echinatior TaxID=103372 RepID=F4WLB9_ACREC|nr:Cytochrome P450 4C1 [Acromyrmex echinatior]
MQIETVSVIADRYHQHPMHTDCIQYTDRNSLLGDPESWSLMNSLYDKALVEASRIFTLEITDGDFSAELFGDAAPLDSLNNKWFLNLSNIDIPIEVQYLLQLGEERLKLFLTIMENCKEGIFIQYIGATPNINIFKPEYLEHIFPSTVNITKGDFYDMLKPWLGNGLLTSTDEQWFHDRKLIGPTFHFNILDQFAGIMFEKAEILTKCLQKEIEKEPGKAVNIFPFIINAALDIICETAMGVDVHAQEVVTKYTSTVHLASSLIMKRLFRPWYWIEWLFYSVPTGKQFKSSLDILHGFTKEVINKRKIERQSQNGHMEFENEDNEFNIGKRKRQAFLDLLLDQNAKSDTPLTDDELRAQVDTFMFEGHDTTAVAITWTLFLLGDNLEHQAKVHEELEEVFGASETSASIKELSKLKYLDRVIKETLRIFPSVPMISRTLTEDVKIDNYILPKGVMITLAILLTHRNSMVWPDPLKFDPDRFLPENSKNRNPYAYVPFSAGPRNCIGQKFAQLEEKIVLTTILRKWRVKSVKSVDTIKFGGSLILRPSEDVLLHFTPKK